MYVITLIASFNERKKSEIRAWYVRIRGFNEPGCIKNTQSLPVYSFIRMEAI